MRWQNSNHQFSEEEAGNAMWFAKAAKGRSMFGRIYPCKMPRGPSEFCSFDGGYFVMRSLLTDELFHISRVMIEDLRELTEMEVIAWAAK